MRKEYRKTELDLELVTVEDLALGSLRKNKDILPIRFKLCHEGANKKGDRFNQDELRAAWQTPQHKPIDWEHEEPIIGCMIDSSLQNEVNDNRLYILTDGAIWGFKYPEYANLVRTGYKDKDLHMSMECWFTDFNVVLGEYDYVVPEADASEDLIKSIGTTINDKFVSRELINVIFGGVACTYTPADPDAVILACASARTEKDYHDYLHRAYEELIPTPMTKEQIIKEHTRVHQENPNIIIILDD